MNILKLRIISKIGLLFVVIGFFLPISCNLNGFQIAKTVETFGGPNILSISLYSIFIFSCIGIILLLALLLKNKFSIVYDWIDLIMVIAAFSVFMYIQVQSSDDPLIALFNRLQSGAYIIFIGLVNALFFLVAASCKTKSGSKSRVKKIDSEFEPEDVDGKELKKENIIMIMLFIEVILILSHFGFFIFILTDLFLIDGFIPFDILPEFIDIPLGIISFLIILVISGFLGVIITTSVTRLILYLIDKETVSYWHKRPDLDYLRALYNMLKRANENDQTPDNNNNVIDDITQKEINSLIEPDEDEKKELFKQEKTEKKILKMQVIEGVLVSIFTFIFMYFIYYLFNDYVSNIEYYNWFYIYFYFLLYVISFFILLEIGFIIGALILIPIMRLIYSIIDKETVSYWRKLPYWNYFDYLFKKRKREKVQRGMPDTQNVS